MRGKGKTNREKRYLCLLKEKKKYFFANCKNMKSKTTFLCKKLRLVMQ